MKKLDYKLVLPGIFIVATSYGLARYAYGLFLPTFRQALSLSDSTLAYIAAISYASYFCITIAGIYLSTRLAPRLSVMLGGLAAVVGMALIAMAQSPLALAAGVAIAGVSPGLAYTPFSVIIATLVSERRRRGIYSLINSGTSLGVMISGPAAMMLGEHWRLAWLGFALFGLISTLWCVSVLPRLPAPGQLLSFAGLSLRSLSAGARGRLFAVSFLIGIATSIYWAFSVDLVTTARTGNFQLLGLSATPTEFGRMFWTLVGISAFAGMGAGWIVERIGVVSAMRVFLAGIAVSAVLIAFFHTAGPVLMSGMMFGAFFVLMAATLGMWSMDLFADLPAVGFGTAFLLLSAGQFTGPFLVGLLIERFDLSAMFVASAIFCVLVTAMLPRHSAKAQPA